MFGRATIRLGIGPHSSCNRLYINCYILLNYLSPFWIVLFAMCFCAYCHSLHYYHLSWPPWFLSSIFFHFFRPRLFSAVADWMSTILPHIRLSANLGCRSETYCTRLVESTVRKISPKNRHLGSIAHLCRAISSQLRHISTIEKPVKP